MPDPTVPPHWTPAPNGGGGYDRDDGLKARQVSSPSRTAYDTTINWPNRELTETECVGLFRELTTATQRGGRTPEQAADREAAAKRAHNAEFDIQRSYDVFILPHTPLNTGTLHKIDKAIPRNKEEAERKTRAARLALNGLYEYQEVRDALVSDINKLAAEGWRVVHAETAAGVWDVLVERRLR